MIAVKICGITESADAVLAAELGASAIGLVFWPNSPRYVDPARAREIVAALPASVRAVGVFVNQTGDAAQIAREVGLAAVQLHGEERADDYRDFPLPVIKAVAVRESAETLREAAAIPEQVTILLDAHDPIRRGGTGKLVDWSVAAAVARTRRVLLSGGLNAGNARAAVDAVKPYGLDVSSGVEAAPGKKDAAKLRAFFAALNGIV